jgi:hypothetical protein
MDFFSILLPDNLLTYLLMGEAGPVVLGDRGLALEMCLHVMMSNCPVQLGNES